MVRNAPSLQNSGPWKACLSAKVRSNFLRGDLFALIRISFNIYLVLELNASFKLKLLFYEKTRFSLYILFFVAGIV